MFITLVLTGSPGSYLTNKKKYLSVASGKFGKYWSYLPNVEN